MSLIQIAIIVSSVLSILIGNLMLNPYFMSLGTILLWLAFFISTVKHWKSNVLVSLFLICFFSFLLGTYSLNLVGLSEFQMENSVIVFTLNMIYTSLCSIWIGGQISNKVKFNFNKSDKTRVKNVAESTIIFEKLALILYWITFPFYMINIILRNNYVMENGYIEYYKSYSGASSIVSYGNIACMFGFYLFLACFPKKRKVLPVIISYLIANIISIIGGSRTSMVVACVFSLFYFLLREGSDGKGTWIKKSYIKWVVISTPFLFAFLGYWAYYRTDTIQSGMSFIDYIVSFIKANGNSSSIIGHTFNLQNTLKNLGHHSYTFGYLVRLFSGLNFGQSSLELVYSGTSLGASVTYLVSSYTFLRGGGLGTCYIAELWIDFGIIGVIIYNLILGYVLKKMSLIKYNNNTFRTLISFAIIQELFTLPRREALCMLPFFSSRVFIILLLISVLLKNTYENKYRYSNKKSLKTI